MKPRHSVRTRTLGQKTKWERKRERRTEKRITAKKKPFVQPLALASTKEFQEGLQHGQLVVYDGAERIPLDLVGSPVHLQGGVLKEYLQGVYKLFDGTRITVRFAPMHQRGQGMLVVRQLKKIRNEYVEIPVRNAFYESAFAFAFDDLSHMYLPPQWRGEKLGTKLASKVERHMRSIGNGTHSFIPSPGFRRLFLQERPVPGQKKPKKILGYTTSPNGGADITKTGKSHPSENLGQYHNIEVIDPGTGRKVNLVIPVQNNP